MKNFCETCGTKLVEKDKGMVWWCEGCQMHHYSNPKPATEMILYRGNKILISERGIHPAKGKFDMPGGFVELHEDFETALAREVKEELGLDQNTYNQPVYLHSYNIAYQYEKVTYRVVVNVYTAALHPDATPMASDDVASLRWIEPSDIATVDWSHQQQKQNAEKVFARLSS